MGKGLRVIGGFVLLLLLPVKGWTEPYRHPERGFSLNPPPGWRLVPAGEVGVLTRQFRLPGPTLHAQTVCWFRDPRSDNFVEHLRLELRPGRTVLNETAQQRLTQEIAAAYRNIGATFMVRESTMTYLGMRRAFRLVGLITVRAPVGVLRYVDLCAVVPTVSDTYLLHYVCLEADFPSYRPIFESSLNSFHPGGLPFGPTDVLPLSIVGAIVLLLLILGVRHWARRRQEGVRWEKPQRRRRPRREKPRLPRRPPWECPQCHLRNIGTATRCANCGTPHPDRAPSPEPAPTPPSLPPERAVVSSPASEASLPTAILVLEDGQTVPLDKEIFHIGRRSDNDWVLKDDQVSRHHATLTFVEGVWWIRDEESRNGTWVNDRRLDRPVRLRPGDRVQIGRTAFNLQATEAWPLETLPLPPTLTPPTEAVPEGAEGKPLTCTACGAENPSFASFCGQCGQAFPSLPSRGKTTFLGLLWLVQGGILLATALGYLPLPALPLEQFAIALAAVILLAAGGLLLRHEWGRELTQVSALFCAGYMIAAALKSHPAWAGGAVLPVVLLTALARRRKA